jgi:hypothetical protein
LGVAQRKKYQRVLIIDSTSRTGRTLGKSIAAIKDVGTVSEIRATCFATTFAARAHLGEDVLFSPIVSPTPKIRPPWDSSGRHVEKEGVLARGA